MSNLKRVLSLVMVIAMIVSMMAVVGAKTSGQITDLDKSEHQPEIRILEALKIIEGYPDNTFRPTEKVTRAQLAQIMARISVGGDIDMVKSYASKSTYSDVDGGYGWAVGGIQYCNDNNIIVGDGNGKFRPADSVTIVEALKMLLATLGYDPDLEGFQNVGEAWKANVLAKANTVGLLKRYNYSVYKECTRDDLALLLYNFLFTPVVKGYFENDVANVNTLIYNPDRCLAINWFFRMNVLVGVVVANEYADLDVYEYVTTSRVMDDDVTMKAGQTRLFLYEAAAEDGLTLGDMVENPDRVHHVSPDKLDYSPYFVDVQVSSDLEDLGKSVVVVVDDTTSKGLWVALGDMMFDTGLNTVTDNWFDPGIAMMPGARTAVYFDDYDLPVRRYYQGEAILHVDAGSTYGFMGGNGDRHKTIDFDGDGKVDIVMVENWGIAQLLGADKRGNVNGSTAIKAGDWEWNKTKATPWNTATNVADGAAIFGVVNFHYVDGMWYSVLAQSILNTPLANTVDAVNFKNGYVTLSDNNQYYQSDVWNMTFGFMDDIMDLVADPKTRTQYDWYLDCGGFIRLYNFTAAAQGTMYLLTDATSVKSGRNAFDKTVDTYQASDEKVTYATADRVFIADQENAPYGDALTNKALAGKAVTNLAAGFATDTSITLADVTSLNKVSAVVEINSQLKANLFSTADTYGKFGDYNVNNGGADSYYVYATTDTDVYYVSLARDRQGKVYVKGVEFFDGYKNVKDFNLDDCSAAYAAVSLNKDNDGDPYYYAEAIVFETWTPTTNVNAPYFFYYHVSNWSDSRPGRFDEIEPTGELGTIDVASITSSYQMEERVPGFYVYDGNTGAAEMITENWGDYGITAAEVAIAKTGPVDYYVLEDVAGSELRLTEDIPVYAAFAAYPNQVDERTVRVVEYDGKLALGDKIIVVRSGFSVKYVLVVEALKYTDYVLKYVYWSNAANYLWETIADGGNLNNYYAPAEELFNAVNDFVLGNTTSMDAILAAFVDCAEADYDPSDLEPEWFAAILKAIELIEQNTLEKRNTLIDAVNDAWDSDMIVIDAYLGNGTVKQAYDALTEAEKDYIWNYDGTYANSYDGEDNMSGWLAILFYEEVPESVKKAAMDLVAAGAKYKKAADDGDWYTAIAIYENELKAAQAAWTAAAGTDYTTDNSYDVDGVDIATAMSFKP